jgi:hypothetical protein
MPTALLSNFWQKLSLKPLSNSTKQKNESASAKLCRHSKDNIMVQILMTTKYYSVKVIKNLAKQSLTPYSIFIIRITPKYKEEWSQNFVHALDISYSSIQLGKE